MRTLSKLWRRIDASLIGVLSYGDISPIGMSKVRWDACKSELDVPSPWRVAPGGPGMVASPLVPDIRDQALLVHSSLEMLEVAEVAPASTG
jgi:hypothetical protein